MHNDRRVLEVEPLAEQIGRQQQIDGFGAQRRATAAAGCEARSHARAAVEWMLGDREVERAAA